MIKQRLGDLRPGSEFVTCIQRWHGLVLKHRPNGAVEIDLGSDSVIVLHPDVIVQVEVVH